MTKNSGAPRRDAGHVAAIRLFRRLEIGCVEGLPDGMPAGDHVRAMEHRATFELAPEAASRARAVVNDELRRAVPPRILEDAILLVSELVSNAVRHAPRAGIPEVELLLKIDTRRIRVVVTDPGAGFVADPRLPTAAESSGWGLYLVDRIADRWGIITKDRNEVWFEIDVAG